MAAGSRSGTETIRKRDSKSDIPLPAVVHVGNRDKTKPRTIEDDH